MTPAITIPKGRPAEIGLDQSALYALGLAHVQDIAGRIWTDYNVHDPGVTTLELLCYALTDLSYRASLPMQDLLASAANNAAEMQKQFFGAARILPNRPLTLLDYRKLLIDLPGVKNAWVKPASLSYYANTIAGMLSREKTNAPGEKEVALQVFTMSSSISWKISTRRRNRRTSW